MHILSDHTLEELIRLCQQDQRAAQREIYRIYSSEMFKVCMRYGGCRQDAEDMLQEGFIKVFGGIHNYRHEGSFEGWMRRIMVNTALRCLQREKKHLHQVPIDQVSLSSEASTNSPFEMDELLTLIQGLPVGYRTVFNLYVMDGYSHQEIGKRLQISESSSRSQLARAKKLLRECLEKRQVQMKNRKDG